MGIREDDWPKAVDFARADNLDPVAWQLTARATRENVVQQERSSASLGKEAGERDGAGDASPAAAVVARAPFFRFGVGLHPWHAHSRSEGWLRDLTALLEEHPSALVGEIGLDKVARTPDTHRVEWGEQFEVFQAQMMLASRLSRPVSVHCVKAHGKLLEYLREAKGCGKGTGGRTRRGDSRHIEQAVQKRRGEGLLRLPPRIALHSFTGSVEVAKDLVRLGDGGADGGGEIFFGFSAAVNMRGDRETTRLLEVLRAVPASKILMETDRHAPGREAAADELLRVCGAISEAKGVSIEEAVALVNGNADRFLAAPPGLPREGIV